MLDGIGKNNKEPTARKATNPAGLYFQETHYAVGFDAWDDKNARQVRKSLDDFKDPDIIYKRREVPYKNLSQVGLEQSGADSSTQFLTEQKRRFENYGKIPRQESCPVGASVVHFGDDPRNLETQTAFTHRPGQTANEYPTTKSKWPVIPLTDPITGKIDPRIDARFRENQNHISEFNYSTVHDDLTMIHDPIAGTHKTRPAHNGVSSKNLVSQVNNAVPPLRSLGAVRPDLGAPDSWLRQNKIG